jgi:ribosome recycling factor
LIKDLLKDAESRMDGAIHALHEDMAGIRTGRAHPGLVEKLQVEYYGAPTPLLQLASISVPEARSIMIKPYDQTTLKAIEKAIMVSDLGVMPNNDGKQIRLNLPPLNEQRRREIVKHMNARVEETRVALRNIRRDVIKDMKDFESEKMISEDELKRGEDDLQKLMDQFTATIDKIVHVKEQEILEV